MIQLLIVDDEPPVLSALRRALRQHFGHELNIETCSDPALALTLVRARSFDIVISDLRMPEVDGLTFLSLVAGLAPTSVRMVLTGTADFETSQRAINEAGVFRYLTKPWSDSDLRCHMAAAIDRARRVRAAAPEPALDPQTAERLRLEAMEPGITAVEWGPGGEVLMPPVN
jgi:YesN/AraC family two-component response regulator